jgi:hypothetical protein
MESQEGGTYCSWLCNLKDKLWMKEVVWMQIRQSLPTSSEGVMRFISIVDKCHFTAAWSSIKSPEQLQRQDAHNLQGEKSKISLKEFSLPSVEDNLVAFMEMRNFGRPKAGSRVRPLVLPPSLPVQNFQVCHVFFSDNQIVHAAELQRSSAIVVFPQNICPYQFTAMLIYNFLLNSVSGCKRLCIYTDPSIAKQVHILSSLVIRYLGVLFSLFLFLPIE